MALNGNLPLVPKITAIVHATPTNARPTPSAWNHEHDRVSDFLAWQWCQIVMRNGQFYHSSTNGASRTAQIPNSFPEPFYQVLQAQVGEPTTHPPPHLPFPPETGQSTTNP